MRRRRARIAACVGSLVLLLAATGCAPIWSPIDASTPAPFSLASIEAKAALPRGWMSSTYEPVGGVWHFTRHGDELEQIFIRRWPKKQVVKGTNRAIRDGMTMQELAALSLDSRRLDDGVGMLVVQSNKPAEVGGRPCYRIDYTYRNAIGLPKRTVEYGCPVGTWMYRFEFNAPVQHYFAAGLPDFEALIETVVFTVRGA